MVIRTLKTGKIKGNEEVGRMNVCMAHRGWSGQAPENTLAAIRLAIEEPRIEAIEIDVQVSKDGIPVIIHDFTLDRTTTGSGNVADFTYKELSRLDAGSWFSPAFAGERIPLLEEVLFAAKGRCRLNLELKTAGDRYPGIERKAAELVRKYGMESEVCMTSFDHQVIKQIKHRDYGVATGLIIGGNPTLLWEQLQETGAGMISMAYEYITAQLAAVMIAQGISIVAWTVNDPQQIRKVMELHPQIQICTNYPERMFPYMKLPIE
jgi:glycerophosphoryl diester phosphodiesterase